MGAIKEVTNLLGIFVARIKIGEHSAKVKVTGLALVVLTFLIAVAGPIVSLAFQ
ncbi:MAG: hypothetical protein AAFS08_18045 [Pseudomonadota bacterium]